MRVAEAYNKKEIIEDDAISKLAEFAARKGRNVRQLFSLFLDVVKARGSFRIHGTSSSWPEARRYTLSSSLAMQRSIGAGKT
ncbi:hypothetical protein KEJ36_05495 [Candidatus Bathyarchaeota archaeon]|nr:hypothetical protein [Candidatus Bathyarchaeota archaeon]